MSDDAGTPISIHAVREVALMRHSLERKEREYREPLAIEEALRQKSVEAQRSIQAHMAIPGPALVVE